MRALRCGVLRLLPVRLAKPWRISSSSSAWWPVRADFAYVAGTSRIRTREPYALLGSVTGMSCSRRRSGLVVGVAAALLLAGCGSPGGVDPGAASSPAALSPPLPFAAASNSPGPQRPRSVSLKIVDPCAVLSGAQRKALALDGDPRPFTVPTFDNAKACGLRDSTHALAASLTLVTTMGIDVWTNGSFKADARPVRVADFPALVVRTPGQATSCDVEVDVADLQFLDVRLGDNGNTVPPSLDQLCQGAQQVATAAVMSLLSPTP